jgi:hypothetical protein
MNKRSARKLVLTTETLRVLKPARLRAVRGGGDLVVETDPVTAPTTDRDGGGDAGRTDRCNTL